MRRYYKKQYQPPARKKPSSKPYQPLQQPEWDDTIHDLSHLKLSPEEQLRRKLSRMSKNQLGVATLGGSNPLPGSSSARYTPSISSAEVQCLSDSGDESSNENEPHPEAHSPGLQRQQQQRRHRQPGFESEDDICQWQDAASSPLQAQRAVLGDNGNSNRSSKPRDNQQQQHRHQDESKSSDKAMRHAAAVTTAPNGSEGHISVPTETLQALFDKIDSLETQIKKQHEQASPAQQHSMQLHQQLTSSQQQLSETQQQLVQLQQQHQEYVSHTSSLLTRLQAQLQQLMSQSPGLGGHGGNINFVQQQQQQHYAATAAASRPPTAPTGQAEQQSTRLQGHSSSILNTLAPAPLSGSTNSSSNGGRSPTKQHLRAAAAVLNTASPRKSVAGQHGEAHPHTAASSPGATSRCEYSGTAAAAAADAAALPSYAEMRQRACRGTGVSSGSSTYARLALAAAGTAGGRSAAAVTADQAAAGRREPAVTAGSSNTAAAGQSAETHPAYRISSTYNTLFSRPVPQPTKAWNLAAAAAAAISGSTVSPQQQQQQGNQNRPGHWSNAAQVASVITEYDDDAPPVTLNPAITADAGVPGLRDTDWGLGQGLPRAAVSRVFTAAGRFEGVEMPKPRVLLDQLKGNMSLSDHLRAAKSTAGASSALRAQ